MGRRGRFGGAVLLGVTSLALGCGGEDKPAEPKQDARNPSVQKRVEARVRRDTEKRIEQETGAYVDPESAVGPARSDCIPETDTKLSCVVEGFANQGFEDGDTAEGDFEWRWEVIVDSDTGRFQARPVDMRSPGG